MSYTRSYSRTVSGSETISISYPASENGGSTSRTVTISIPIDIYIEVNTVPFDISVDSCKNHIDVVTGAVVAANSAQVVAINQSAKKISDSVVNGFFGLIRSELSQQISEYRPRVEVLTIELQKLQEACLDKRRQMGQDYEHITKRYTGIFNDLDDQLRHRVKSLNSQVFDTKTSIAAQLNRPVLDFEVNITTVFNAECSNARAMFFASGLKSRALSLIKQAKNFLLSEKKLYKGLKLILHEEAAEGAGNYLLPVVYMEAEEKTGSNLTTVIYDKSAPGFNIKGIENKMEASFKNNAVHWQDLSKGDRDKIETHLYNQINSPVGAAGQHEKRVVEMMMNLWNNNNFETSFQS